MELLACSGPGAGAAISRSIQLGYLHAAGLVALIAVAAVVPVALGARWRAPKPLLILLLVHPAWTVSAVHGDCGHLKRAASWAVTVLGCAIAAWHVVHTMRHRRTTGDLRQTTPVPTGGRPATGTQGEGDRRVFPTAATCAVLGLSAAVAVGFGLPALDALPVVHPLALLGLLAVSGVAVWAGVACARATWRYSVAHREPTEPRDTTDRGLSNDH
jgi:hypothetical protein